MSFSKMPSKIMLWIFLLQVNATICFFRASQKGKKLNIKSYNESDL